MSHEWSRFIYRLLRYLITKKIRVQTKIQIENLAKRVTFDFLDFLAYSRFAKETVKEIKNSNEQFTVFWS